jgi:signal peptidase I
MRRGAEPDTSMVPPAEDDEDDLDGVLRIDEKPRRPHRASRSRRTPPKSTTEPVRRWRSAPDDEGWDEEIDGPRPPPARRPVFWRARDSLYFEPLVALAILALLLVSLFAYTSNWPPVYVVESNSMQHGSGDHLGVLNAGDIVLAQKTSEGSIVTYVDALRTSLSTYGLAGDVLLYYPNGSTSATPVIHRAVVFFQYTAANGTYEALGLAGLACGPGGAGDVYFAEGTTGGCGTYLRPPDNLTIYNVGHRTVTVNFATEELQLGTHSGYLTLGDNNSYPDQLPGPGLPPLSSLVEPAWVIGVARGLIPWFGAVKLLFDGNAGKVPAASWEFLGLTIAGVIFAAAGVHLLARRGRRERAEPDPEREPERPRRSPGPGDAPTERPPSPASRPSLRPWKAADPPVDPPAPRRAPPPRPREEKPRSYEQRRRAHFVTSHEKSLAPRKKAAKADDEEESDD